MQMLIWPHGSAHIKLPCTCLLSVMIAWLLVLNLLFRQTFKVHHPHSKSISLHFFSIVRLRKISHKTTVNFNASLLATLQIQLWLRYTKIMIHHYFLSSELSQIELVRLSDEFLRVEKLEQEQVSTVKRVTRSFCCVNPIFIAATGLSWRYQFLSQPSMSFNYLMISNLIYKAL